MEPVSPGHSDPAEYRKVLPKTNGCFLNLIKCGWNFKERTSSSYRSWWVLCLSLSSPLCLIRIILNITGWHLKHFLTRRLATCKTWVVFKHQKGTPLITQDSLIHSLLLKDHKLQFNTIIKKNYNLSFCQQILNPDRKCVISRCLPL